MDNEILLDLEKSEGKLIYQHIRIRYGLVQHGAGIFCTNGERTGHG